jgi:hypothetical protein
VLKEGEESFGEIIRRPLLIKGMRRKFGICCGNYNKMNTCQWKSCTG